MITNLKFKFIIFESINFNSQAKHDNAEPRKWKKQILFY